MLRDKGTKQKSLGKGSFYLLPFALCLGNSPAWSAPLRNWQYDPAANQLEVTVKNGVKPRYFLMAQPARIVLDLPETEVGNVQTQQTYDGAVRQVRVSQFQPGLTRIVLELSPGTVLMREQAKLQQVGGETASQRWVLRPLVASTSTASAAKPAVPPALASSPVSSARNQAPVLNPPGLPSTEAAPETEKPALPEAERSSMPPSSDKPIEIVVSRPSSSAAPAASAPAATSVPAAASTSLPPTTVPTVVTTSPIAPAPPTPDRFPPGIAPISPAALATPPASETAKPLAGQVEVAKSSSDLAAAPERSAETSTSSSGSSTALQLPDVNSSLSIPDSLPPVSAPESSSATPSVTVPPIRPSAPEAAAPPAVTNSTESVRVPPLPTAASMRAVSRPIEFGQPLPIAEPTAVASGSILPSSQIGATGDRAFSDVLLPAGTLLNLQYAGTQPLSLQAGQPRQEVLVLPTELRDAAGNLMASEGATILGRFETSSSGSRFVAQTISLRGQSVAIVAQSDVLGGTRRVSENRLFRNSGIGALAGAILGGLSGGNVFGGAAAGAALTYVTAPKPATIQPGQMIQVRLTEDLR